MRHNVFKLFWSWDFEKEEAWLNEMSAKGLQLVGVAGFRYTFEQSFPGEYKYRLELLDWPPSHPESVSYINFLKEAEVEHVGSYARWAYFRYKTADSTFKLFSDIDSRYKHLKRILTLLLVLLPVQVGVLAPNIFFLIHGFHAVNLVIAVFITAVIILLSYGSIKIWSMMNRLKKDRFIHE